MAKHKHYDLIVAWANGAKIECREAYTGLGAWVDCPGPSWGEHGEYRIKPDPRAARDMAIAQAVRSGIYRSRLAYLQDEELAAIIASVKEGA